MKYLNFRIDGRSSLQYCDLSISSSKNFSSKKEYDLDLKLELVRHIEIKNNQNDQAIIGQGSEIGLLNTILELSFELDNNSKITFFMRPNHSFFNPKLNVGSITIFSTKLTSNDIEKLCELIKGQRIFLRWNIRGYADIFVNNIHHIAFIDESNLIDNRDTLPHLNSQDFASKILERTDLSEEFSIQFPIKMSISDKSTFSTELRLLIQELKLCNGSLEEAVKQFRNSNSINDYKLVMLHIKSALDSLRKYKEKKKIGEELLIDLGVVGNVDPKGGDIAAEEIIDDIFKIMDCIYQIASKPGHKITRKTKESPSPLKFNMSPDRAETIYCLTMSLASYKYLFEKIRQID